MTQKSSRRVQVVAPNIWLEPITDNVDWKLLLACTLRHVPIAREALSQGANVNCRRSDYLTPLHIAVQHNDAELIQLLCDQPSVSIEAKIIDGSTSLHKAVFLGHKGAVKKLIENGAVVNCTDNLGRYPLHYAALRKDTESATLLLTNGAHVNVYDVFHESPLYTSVILRPFLPMIQLLLTHGALVSSGPDQLSLGLLLEAVLCTWNIYDMKILDILFQNGVDINATDFIGLRTPLHIAAMTGDSKLASYLIEKGADLNQRNKAGRTPLEVALLYRNFETAQLIENSLLKLEKLKLHRTINVISFTEN